MKKDQLKDLILWAKVIDHRLTSIETAVVSVRFSLESLKQTINQLNSKVENEAKDSRGL